MQFTSRFFNCFVFASIFLSAVIAGFSQTGYQPNGFTANQPATPNYLSNSSVFRQEIARLEINIVRQGEAPMPITQVPRLEKNDELRVRLLDEPVNGLKPDQSNFEWTLLIAYINPGRNIDKTNSVTEEIQFRKSGWYKEYSFVVPYDSQPVFFLYPKPNYRSKILKLINENQEEIRKIGEKTIEIADAYAKIGSFLSELQTVINRNQYSQTYGNYGGYGAYGGAYGYYGTNTGYNQNALMEQSIERLARSFNIQLPACWQNGSNVYGGYAAGAAYNSGYGGYGSYAPANGGFTNDFIGRAQCVAKNVRLEDFDLSVSRMLQQGGILAASQLSQKYPQIAFWINIAAAAVDLILKITRKSPLKLVPTVTSSVENPAIQNAAGYQQSYSAAPNAFAPVSAGSGGKYNSVKISLFAEAAPNDNGFVTAYPVVVHKWQANPDPETIKLPAPALMESCLHVGQNVLRSTDLMTDWMADNFTKDFKLTINSPAAAAGGFRKEFPLKKNVGLNGWELNLTEEELSAFPKNNAALEAVVTGKRGFNDIKSPKFPLPPLSNAGWEVEPQAQNRSTAQGKRTLTLRNRYGNCGCLRAVILKTSSGQQLSFEANSKENALRFSDDGNEVSLEVDAALFFSGQGTLELRTVGGGVTSLSVNLPSRQTAATTAMTTANPPRQASPAARQIPVITDLKISKGANRGVITGERLELLQFVRINGLKARVVTATNAPSQNLKSNKNSAQNSNQRAIVFENPEAELLTETVSIVLGFRDGQTLSYPLTFNVGLKAEKAD